MNEAFMPDGITLARGQGFKPCWGEAATSPVGFDSQPRLCRAASVPPRQQRVTRFRGESRCSRPVQSCLPFHCEFCDIPELYGRNPHLKKYSGQHEPPLPELRLLLSAAGYPDRASARPSGVFPATISSVASSFSRSSTVTLFAPVFAT